MWWNNPETFNEKYAKEVDWVLANIELNDNRYNPETGTIKLENGSAVSIVKAKYYCPPPELVEFRRNIQCIIKPHTNVLNLCVDDLTTLYETYSWIDQNAPINYMDWVGLLREETYIIAYINCNPQSTQYGNVLMCDDMGGIDIMYNNISELITDISEWMNFADTLPDFNIDKYLDRGCSYQPFMNKYMTNRDLLQSDFPGSQQYKSQVSGTIKREAMYKRMYMRSFSNWAWCERVKK